jgi:hypothetical protein
LDSDLPDLFIIYFMAKFSAVIPRTCAIFPLPCDFIKHPRNRPSRQKFLPGEDDMLRSLVGQYGDRNWSVIASYMKRRSARQCRERYKNYLSPAISTRPWSEEEEALLTEKVAELGQKWSQIAVFFDGRSDVNLKNRWAAIVVRNERVKRWEKARSNATVDDPLDALARSLLGDWNRAPADSGLDDF